MPTRLIRLHISPVVLSRLAAGLALTAAASAPALAAGPQGTPEGVVRTVAAESPAPAPAADIDADASIRTWSGPEQIISGPMSGSAYGSASVYTGVDGGMTNYVRTDHPPLDPRLSNDPAARARLWAARNAMQTRDVLPPHLAGYDAYLPPDHGWQMPIGYPVQRQVLPYTNYFPHQWYGLPGSQKPRVAPHVFMPTDTTQLGYSYQHVPTWQPAPAGAFPAPPDPRTIHRTEQAGGPDIGVYPGHYYGEPRVGHHHGSIHDPVTGQTIYGGTYGAMQGGTIVSEPAAPTINYGPALGVPASPEPDVQVEPLPSSTEPLPGSDSLPGAPVPDDAVAPPAVEA
ncbi:hypothetical protein [Alienimonas chondri]|uniref:Secreted protein n=1 Tax=Alienimonas chondri TaxID=2681879 RepID=A0ABX1VGU2_9PLAN|nr:hypothetical protein [Alienimonas chondri]NNJ27004.1 hypothetical protein [Alienimonas chondri]